MVPIRLLEVFIILYSRFLTSSKLRFPFKGSTLMKLTKLTDILIDYQSSLSTDVDTREDEVVFILPTLPVPSQLDLYTTLSKQFTHGLSNTKGLLDI